MSRESMKNNLFLLIGENKEKLNFNLYDILNNIEYDENDKIIYDMNVDKFSDVIEEASMESLFSSIKIIIVNNFLIDNLDDNDIGNLEQYISMNIKDVYMIFISSKVDARKKNYKLFKDNFKIIELEKIDLNNISDYVRDKVKDCGYRIDSMNIDYFLSKVGNDINNINSELDKLIVYKNDDKVINREDIDLLAFDNIDNVIYEFTNAIIDNDYDKIKVMYDKFMIDNVGIDYLISSLAGSFRTSLIVKILKNKNMSNIDIAKFIGKKEYYVKKSLDRLYGYTINDLCNYINKLAMIDRNIKSGKDNVGMFEIFLFEKEV